MEDRIILKKVRVHNLKGVDLELKRNQLTVFTGVSGSGKSSLAFDTIHVEGQRRYVESLSTYARRHLGEMAKPDADHISGISPTIAIEQKTAGRNPRSTVGTITGIYDYLRVLYARTGIAHCPVSGEKIAPQHPEKIIRRIHQEKRGAKVLILAPYVRGKKGEFKDEFDSLLKKGILRIRLDGEMVDLSEEISLDKKRSHDIDLVIDRLQVEEERGRLAESVMMALEWGQGTMIALDPDAREEIFFSTHATCVRSGQSYPPLEPHDFSFNHPAGMCPTCHGLKNLVQFDLSRVIDEEKSIAEDCCEIAGSYQTVKWGNIYDNLGRLYHFSVKTPWKNLSESAKKVFLFGTENKWTRMQFVHPVKKSRWIEFVQWRGVIFEAQKRVQEAKSDLYRDLMKEEICPDCHGSGIRPYPAATLVGEKKIADLCSMPLEKTAHFFETLQISEQEWIIAEELVKEILKRIQFLINVGLHYLSLDRISPSLSGGEAQRVRLASQIGSGLVGTTYILDEPSIGLHPRDNRKLIATLKALRDMGNSVIVVEHDEDTVLAADEIVDVGPGAGRFGGEIVAQGNLEAIIGSARSLTGDYLAGRLSIPIPKKRRKGNGSITIKGACHHNLKNVSVDFPLAVFIAVTGVSGSGKSSLVSETLFPALSNFLHNSRLSVGRHDAITGIQNIDKAISIDQRPIGRSPRSNPATYIKLFDEIRDFFASLPESVAQGYKPGRFSFNVREGSCPRCSGMGMIRIDMDFMEDEWVVCQHCSGKRFDGRTLAVLYKGKSIHDILEMSVSDAKEFFSAHPSISRKLEFLERVGLDYLRLGQSSTTLSGGEAQRIKLARELSRVSTGNTLYLLDEPTTGLHPHDIAKLIDVLQALVTKGNSVLVIEHNMDLIKTADYIIDLGPEGGDGGGKVIATGTPEKVARSKTETGAALTVMLDKPPLKMEKHPSTDERQCTSIIATGCAQNNLKKIHVAFPYGKITVCTGPSGSGKSSFAFETIYAEGQRRYVETLSPYARQFIREPPKPVVEEIQGLSPPIAIEQKQHAGNPRSTVGTMTESYDFLRLLFAHLGIPYCPETQEEIRAVSQATVASRLLTLPERTRLFILAPLKLRSGESFEELKEKLQREGFLRIRLNKEYFELDQEIPYSREKKNELLLLIDRLVIGKEMAPRLLDALEQAASRGNNTLVAEADGKDQFFNLSFSVESTGKSYPPITPHTFSFNTPEGMCPDCQGLGFQYGADLSKQKSLMKLSPLALIDLLWKEFQTETSIKIFQSFLKKEKIPSGTALQKLQPGQLNALLNGVQNPVEVKKGWTARWIGLNQVLIHFSKGQLVKEHHEFLSLLDEMVCPSCLGSRLNPLARNVRLQGMTIAELTSMTIEDLFLKLQTIEAPHLSEVKEQLEKRIHFLKKIGLGYLTLGRSAPTLSGGEAQRIRLSRQLGSGLTGCLYVLDEPTIGLHSHDNALLNQALLQLCSLGNTILLVEHDPLTIEIADWLLDFGPGAGKNGGKIMAQGTVEEIKKNPLSLTGNYLSGRKKIPIPASRRTSKQHLKLERLSLHNLKNIDVAFPLQAFSCITGVSGSGKSTLLSDLLKKAAEETVPVKKDTWKTSYGSIQGFSHFDRVIALEQSPIGRTMRADISTYTDLLSPLRHFFAQLPEAKIRGLQPKQFSFNHRKGMCPACQGLGFKIISLQFLPPVKVACDACHGFRLNPLSLEVHYLGKHLGQILAMTVTEALKWLEFLPKAKKILDTLVSVGLDYLCLNQEINTLSGGEAQRLRLSRELSKRSSGKTLYLFDEPTIGLHSEDIRRLLLIFHALVDRGNTLILIEHNLDVIANADYIADLGPDAGERGGYLTASGTPEEIARHPTSHTAKYLAPFFQTHIQENHGTTPTL